MGNNEQKKIQTDKGSAMFIAVLMMLALSLVVINGVASPVFRDTKIIMENARSKNALVASESGVEDVVFRIKNNMDYDAEELLTLGDSVATTTVDDSAPPDVSVVGEGVFRRALRRTAVSLTVGDGIAFNYGVHAGEGGVDLQNTASIQGNVNSNGPITGSGSNLIKGTAISAGPSGLISGVHATSSLFAHTLSNVTGDADAYYVNISGASIAGNLYPDSLDQSSAGMPISDEQIEEWKTAALQGGIINSPCPYKIQGAMTIGPLKINCDLEISGNNFTLNIAGHIWVDGDITVKNGPIIRVADAIAGTSVAIIADNDTDRSEGGTITLENSAVFQGNGGRSYIMFISRNESASTGGDEEAIEVKNTVSGDLLVYAPYGEVELQNSIDLKEVTAYKIELKNSAEVIYETGLINLLFDSGPGGGFDIGGWSEIE